jgi:CO/xanthine dehydrogenase FAD-binding subunit
MECARAAEAALSDAAPLRHNTYEVSLAKALIQRALMTLGAEEHADT